MSNKPQVQGAARDAQALLAVFTLPPPPDFAAQVLARVHARHPASLSRPAPHGSLPAAGRSFQSFWPASRQAWSCSRRLRGAVAFGLLVAATVLLWLAFTQTPLALTTGQTACTLSFPTAPATSAKTSMLPPDLLQSARAPEPEPQQAHLETVQRAPQTERPAQDSSALSSALSMPNHAQVQGTPPSQHVEQPRSLRGKNKRVGRGLRPNKV